MTAGGGVQHSEMFPLVNRDRANTLELFQVWLNLPAQNKMVEPHFSMFWASDIPQKAFVDEAGNKTTVDVIAGVLEETQALQPPPDSWAGNPDNHVAIWTIVMSAGARWQLPKAAAGLNRTLYLYQGSSLNVDGVDIAPMHSIELQSDADAVLQNANEECRLLLLQGRPINQPVEQYGPFVMNTRNEIMQAMKDYQETEFGGWPWPNRDQVHTGKRRFARHADGKIEEAE
ncbi:MAG: pirin-like C-terminal cupin domain-containing protein, partial [Arenicellales bacterium]